MMQMVHAGGAAIPALGFGVLHMSDEQVDRIVPSALDAGFRHFDTAQIYGNEAALGRALKAAGAQRDTLFITTKVWVDKYSESLFSDSVDESLEKLGMDRVDLLLLHWPGNEVPVEAQIDMLNAVQAAGKTRHIGVSNYNVTQLETVVGRSSTPIVTNQVEAHPYVDQSRIIGAAARNDVSITAYYAMANGKVPADPALAAIGAPYGKSAAQVALRWLVQNGLIALTKTVQIERVPENAAIFDFALSDADMAKIAALGQPDGRIVNPPGLAPDWNA
jgi:diketogulonate reductase-like aldo/keto reductase